MDFSRAEAGFDRSHWDDIDRMWGRNNERFLENGSALKLAVNDSIAVGPRYYVAPYNLSSPSVFIQIRKSARIKPSQERVGGRRRR